MKINKSYIERLILQEMHDLDQRSEWDDSYMICKSLQILIGEAKMIHDAVKSGVELPSWAESKIYKATDYIGSVGGQLYRDDVGE